MGYLAAYSAGGIGCRRALYPKGCAAHGAILVPNAQSESLYPLSKPSSRPEQSKAVIPAGAADGFIVRCAVEGPPHFAFVFSPPGTSMSISLYEDSLDLIYLRTKMAASGTFTVDSAISCPRLVSAASFSRFSAGRLSCGKPTGFSFS
jgi:hypothetical protein